MSKIEFDTSKIVIDTREKTPYPFEGAIKTALLIGDYSITGLEDEIAIERKQVEEMFFVCGQQRKRFLDELSRSEFLKYFAIVIEGNMDDIIKKQHFSKGVTPRAVMRSLLTWSVQYGAHVFFCGSRENGMATTLCLLEKYLKICEKKT